MLLRGNPSPKNENQRAIIFALVDHLNQHHYFAKMSVDQLKNMVREASNGALSLGALVRLTQVSPQVDAMFFREVYLNFKGILSTVSLAHLNGDVFTSLVKPTEFIENIIDEKPR